MGIVILALCGTSALAQDPPLPRVTVREASGRSHELEWVDDTWLAAVVQGLSKTGGGTLEFSPGVFTFDRGVRVAGIRGVHFLGSPGTVFRMRPMDEFGAIHVSAPARLEDGAFEVDRPELIRPHGYYQLFRPTLEGNRILEFEVASVAGTKVTLEWFRNAAERSVPRGTLVIPAPSFFDGGRCEDISFRGIVFDGNFDVWNARVGARLFYGHTMHCGVLLRNRYVGEGDEPARRPATRIASIVGCTFRNLLGRGVAVYNMEGVTISDCRFENIGAEAAEIDHLCAEAAVLGCTFHRAKLGLRLNDCTDTVVNGCVFVDCKTGLIVTRGVKDPALNERIAVSGNTFKGGVDALTLAENAGDVSITGNVVSGARRVGITLRGRSVLCSGNVVTGSRVAGIRVHGQGCLVEKNVIAPPEPRPKSFVEVDRRDR